MMFVVFLAQVLSAATPLVLASLGGVLSERAGVTMLALEAYLLVGAFAAVVAGLASGSVLVALLAARSGGSEDLRDMGGIATKAPAGMRQSAGSSP